MKDERFERGIELFNREEFFEAHEVWEDFWHEYREMDRPFLQGLIQLAAGFYHVQCQNTRGALSQLEKGSRKLKEFLPEHNRIHVSRLCGYTDAWAKALENGTDRPSFPRID